MTPEQAFESLGSEVAEIVLLAVRNELEQQGHNMTGALSNSIQYQIKAEATKVMIEYSLYDYGMVQNYGIKPENIKIGRGLIDGLTKFVERRIGKSGKEATSIAFAIAKKMKKEGMPTKNAFGYSKNGRRLNWIDEGLKEANPKVVEAINRILPVVIDTVFIQGFTEIMKNNSENVKIKVK